MNTDHVVVYGAGGHGKVVADILIAAGRHVVGFVDDANCNATVMGLPVLGSGDWLFDGHPATRLGVALGVGNADARARILNRCLAAGLPVLSAIHPRAVVSPSAIVGEGVVVMANACVNPDARLGTGAIVNTGAVVEHDCIVGEYAHVGPNATMSGSAKLGPYAQLWTAAVVLPGLGVGERSVVGAGAVVVADLPAGVVAVGVPARVIRRVRSEDTV